jgi:hypothetical protein
LSTGFCSKVFSGFSENGAVRKRAAPHPTAISLTALKRTISTKVHIAKIVPLGSCFGLDVDLVLAREVGGVGGGGGGGRGERGGAVCVCDCVCVFDK